DYRIVDLANSSKYIENGPAIDQLQAGLNTLQIPIDELKLEIGHLYQLEVKAPRGQMYYLRFQIRK
ncbi:MAG: hypothetical protein AAFR97_16315, partial [Bacteroidota bacterium]